MEIAQRLAAIDPENASSQVDPARSHARLAAIYEAQGDKREALVAYRKGRDLLAPIAENAEVQGWSDMLDQFDKDIKRLNCNIG